MANFERTPIHDIMVWGGEHGKRRMIRGRFGNRPRGEGGPGVPLVRSLQKQPIRTANGMVEADIANPKAVKHGVRYVEANLTLGEANPEKYMNTVDGKLVPGIMERSRDRDLVVSVHQQPIPSDLDYVFVGPNVNPDIVFGFAELVGIKTVFVGEDFGIQSKLPQTMLVDLSQKSERNDVAFWRSQLATALKEGLPSPSVKEFTIYAHADLTDSEQQELGLNGKRFKPLVDEVPGASTLLRVNRPVYALYTQGLEVVTPLLPQDLDNIRAENDMLQLPTLRSLPNWGN